MFQITKLFYPLFLYVILFKFITFQFPSRYPGEEELIRNYKEHISWIVYKRGIVVQELAYQKAKGIKRAEKTCGLISIDIKS